MELIMFLAIALVASILGHAFQYSILLKSKKNFLELKENFLSALEAEKASVKKSIDALPPGKDAADMLHDLTVFGQSIVRVERVDPNDFLIRSPRR